MNDGSIKVPAFKDPVPEKLRAYAERAGDMAFYDEKEQMVLYRSSFCVPTGLDYEWYMVPLKTIWKFLGF